MPRSGAVGQGINPSRTLTIENRFGIDGALDKLCALAGYTVSPLLDSTELGAGGAARAARGPVATEGQCMMGASPSQRCIQQCSVEAFTNHVHITYKSRTHHALSCLGIVQEWGHFTRSAPCRAASQKPCTHSIHIHTVNTHRQTCTHRVKHTFHALFALHGPWSRH
jgi:hypothetical protein